MKIRELTLRNYRIYSEQPPFKFRNRFTIVAGINGRGKTALLDGLALLFSRFISDIFPAYHEYLLVKSSEVHIGMTSSDLSMNIDCAGYLIKNYKLNYDLNRKDRKIRTTKLPPALKQEIRARYGDPMRTDDAVPLAVYYTTDRASYRLPKKFPPKLPYGQAAAYSGALRNRTVNYRDFMARYRSAIVVERTERKNDPNYIGDPAVKAISDALSTFLDGFEKLRVQEKPLSLLIDKNGKTLDLSQLSDGERSFLAMICDLGRRLALANPLLDNPLHGAGVVLIDELELHLHPKWQREVREKLLKTFPNIQFITTTHSPFIIQSLQPGELINLDPDELDEYSNKSIEDIAENVMGVELPQKSERYLKMMDAAEEYFRLLRNADKNPIELAKAEKRLDELSMPFSDDPAFQSLLKLEREALNRGGDDATD